jgi:arylsulfatase
MGDRTNLVLYPGAYNLVEDAILNFKNVSSRVTADVDVTKGRKENGVIFSQGGRFGGWSIYLEDGVPAYAYNYVGKLYTFKGKKALKSGNAKIRVDVSYDGGGVGKGATVKLFVNNEQVGGGRLNKTVMARFSIDEGADVGLDRGTQVTIREIGDNRFSAFTGDINKVSLSIYPEKAKAVQSH